MAKYALSLRNARMTVLLNEYRGGTIHFCKGVVPAALAVPASIDILTSHDITAGGGSVTDGKLSFPDPVVAPATATGTGTITYAVIVKSGAALGQHAVPSQMAVTLNGSSTLAVTSGASIDVDLLEVVEGNP